jgi:hypothetical protein
MPRSIMLFVVCVVASACASAPKRPAVAPGLFGENFTFHGDLPTSEGPFDLGGCFTCLPGTVMRVGSEWAGRILAVRLLTTAKPSPPGRDYFFRRVMDSALSTFWALSLFICRAEWPDVRPLCRPVHVRVENETIQGRYLPAARVHTNGRIGSRREFQVLRHGVFLPSASKIAFAPARQQTAQRADYLVARQKPPCPHQ